MDIARFNLWWAERSRREQGLLALMFALLVLVMAWLLVARPLIGALDEARLRHGQAVIALAEARAQASRGGNSSTAPAVAATLPVERLIIRSAIEAGFTEARIAGQGPARASVAVGAARAPAYFAWLANLEGQGLRVESLRVTANPDRTLTTVAILAARPR